MIGINHVALEVDDIEAALEFYGSVFELKMRGRHEGMAFIDMGDQFLNLSEGHPRTPDRRRHFGLVVDDRQAVREALESMEVEILPGPGLDFIDPWGNRVQVVDYRDIQFTKAPQVLLGMGLADLAKTQEALKELEDKGLISTR